MHGHPLPPTDKWTVSKGQIRPQREACRHLIRSSLNINVTLHQGHAIAQAVSCQFPTAAARVRAQARSCRICGGQSGTGVGFLRVLRSALPILIPSTAPHSSPIIGAGTRSQRVADVPSGLKSHPTPRNLKNYSLTHGAEPFLRSCQLCS
jgi:hypothetical protein